MQLISQSWDPIKLQEFELSPTFFGQAIASRAYQNKESLETVPYKIREGSFKIVEKISNLSPNDFFGSITIFNESEEDLDEVFEINLDTCKNPFGFKLLNPFTFKGK